MTGWVWQRCMQGLAQTQGQPLHPAAYGDWLSKGPQGRMVWARRPCLRLVFIRLADSVPRAEAPMRNKDANRPAPSRMPGAP